MVAICGVLITCCSRRTGCGATRRGWAAATYTGWAVPMYWPAGMAIRAGSADAAPTTVARVADCNSWLDFENYIFTVFESLVWNSYQELHVAVSKVCVQLNGGIGKVMLIGCRRLPFILQKMPAKWLAFEKLA